MDYTQIEEKHNLYDRIITTAMINMYSLSKEKEEIILKNVDPNNISHLFMIEIAKIVNLYWGFKIKIQTSFFNFRKLKKQLRLSKKNSKRISPKKKNYSAIKIEKFLKDIQKAYEGEPSIFRNIYDAYYARNEVR